MSGGWPEEPTTEWEGGSGDPGGFSPGPAPIVPQYKPQCSLWLLHGEEGKRKKIKNKIPPEAHFDAPKAMQLFTLDF